MDRGWRSGTRGCDTGLAPDAGARVSGALSLKTAAPATRSARAGAAWGGGAGLAIHRDSIGERSRGGGCGSRAWGGAVGWGCGGWGEGGGFAIHRDSIGERSRGADCGSRVWSGALGWVAMAKLCELLIFDN